MWAVEVRALPSAAFLPGSLDTWYLSTLSTMCIISIVDTSHSEQCTVLYFHIQPIAVILRSTWSAEWIKNVGTGKLWQKLLEESRTRTLWRCLRLGAVA